MLNEKQLEAVEFKDGPCLTLAGPGSGKTTVLVDRIISLIDKGVDPASILVITFTKDAATEMKNRFLNKTEGSAGEVVFGTFHSVFYKILKSSSRYRDYELLNETKKQSIYMECLRDFPNIKATKENLVFINKEVSLFYNSGKRGFKDEESIFSEEEFFRFLNAFSDRKKLHRVMDFDDILVLTRDILTVDEDLRRVFQRRFSYFLVDELQDINKVQFDVLKLLVKDNPGGSENIFGVGDDDQSIYGFRGSSPKFMLDFPNEFPGTKTVVLDRNYRSAGKIVEFSKNLIEENKERFPKDYKANSNIEGQVSVLNYENENDEAKEIADILIKESKEGRLRDTAILYRNRKNRELLYAILKHHEIKIYTDDTMEDFRDTEICKDIVSALKIVLSEYKREDIIRIMNKPERNLSRGGLFSENICLKKWRDFYPENTESYLKIDELIKNFEIMKGLSPFSFLNYLRVGLMYDSYLKDKANDAKEEYMEYFRTFDMILSYSKEFNSKRALLKDLLKKKDKKPVVRDNEPVSFYTFHGSKGLEFDRVFILDCVEGITPSKNAKNIELTEEERRMFYVAMTRAKESLYLCVPKKISGEKVNPSRFVFESGVDMI